MRRLLKRTFPCLNELSVLGHLLRNAVAILGGAQVVLDLDAIRAGGGADVREEA